MHTVFNIAFYVGTSAVQCGVSLADLVLLLYQLLSLVLVNNGIWSVAPAYWPSKREGS